MKHKTQIFRYLVVGTLVVFVDLGVYYLLNQSLSYSLAKGISFIASSFAGYFLHRGWTFEHTNASLPAAIKYTAINTAIFGFNILVNKGVLTLSPEAVFIGWVVASALTGVLTFVCYKWWVFKM